MFSLLVFFLIGLLLFVVWGCLSFDWTFSIFGFLFRDVSFDFYLDDISVVCLVMLFCCGSVALFYCYHYFGGSSDSSLLYPLMVWFLGVMGILVVSGNVLFSLFLWEYLGLVSFFLILFYSNMSSLRASLITLFASRFGDVALFFLISWGFWWFDFSYFLSGVLLLLVVLTKSASYPFISWLLEAMRAPTPVSSLVHSSTLVAAGIWFFFRYSQAFVSEVMSALLILSLTTVVLSGLSAMFFNDLKKLVALSTCNNVSWCLVFFILGDLNLALLQLLTHGVCKCYLFMTIGDLMGLSGSSQSAVGVFLARYSGSFGVCLQTMLITSLCGFPFLGVFFSKHGLFSEVFYLYGAGCLLLTVFGLLLSFSYSFRFLLLLLKEAGGLSVGYSSSFMLIVFISVFGTILNFLGGGLLVETVGLTRISSFLVLGIQVFGCLIGCLFYWLFGVSGLWGSSLFYSDSVVKGIYGWFVYLSSAAFLSFYRWELYLVGLWPRMVSGVEVFRVSVFSFNTFVLMLFFAVFILFAV